MAWASLSCLFNTTYVEIVIRDWCLRRSSPHSDTMYFEHEHFMVTSNPWHTVRSKRTT